MMVRVGQFPKVSFTPSLNDGVFHADSKNGLFSCLGQAPNLHSGFKVWPFLRVYRRLRLDETVFGQNFKSRKLYFICIFMSLAWKGDPRLIRPKKAKKQIYSRAHCANWVFFSEQIKGHFWNQDEKLYTMKVLHEKLEKDWPTLEFQNLLERIIFTRQEFLSGS